MSTVTVSSKGQIVLPAAVRRRLGLGAGARIEVVEEADGLKLRVLRPVVTAADVAGLAGLVKAPRRGVPRRLEDFRPGVDAFAPGRQARMNALDTNVLARFFIDDEDDERAAIQRPAAVGALSQRGFVTVTVLLEFEWVTRGFYRLTTAQVAQVMSALAAIEHIIVEDRAAALSALGGYAGGLDFADALHLARSGRAEAFLTFDRKLAKRASAAGLGPPVDQLA